MGASEEVKIVVKQESQGNALDQTRKQLDGVADSGKRAAEATRKAGEAPARGASGSKPAPAQAAPAKPAQPRETKPYFSRADVEKAEAGIAAGKSSARKDALQSNRRMVTQAERELATARANGADGDTIQQLGMRVRTRKLAGRFMREQGLSEIDANQQADALIKAQDAAKKRDAAAKAATKERLDGEKKTTQEAKEQERTFDRIKRGGITLGTAMVNGGSLGGGMGSMAGALGLGGIATAGVVGTGMLVQQLTQDYMERKGIDNRIRANRASDERELDIRAGWRGTSSGARSAQFKTEDELFERKNNREEILRRNQRAWYNPLRWINGRTTWEGRREQDENERNIDRLEERRGKEISQSRKKFDKEEGGLELDALRQRSKRTMSGFRSAAIDDFQREWLSNFRRAQSLTPDPEKAKEMADLTVQNQLREKQGAIGNQLLDARAGAGDIASVAKWAGAVVPDWGQLKTSIDSMHATLKTNGANSHEAQTREPWQ